MNQARSQVLVTLVRHGETFMNVEKVMQGHSDTPLSEIGIEQAKKLGKYLSGNTKFTKAYASDLQRAHNTANLILNEGSNTTALIKDSNLRERAYGDGEGRPFAEYLERAKKAKLHVRDFIPPGGESHAEITKRAADFFQVLCKISESNTGDEHVLVVSHGGWIHTFMAYLNENAKKKYRLKNFSPTEAIRIHHNTGVTTFRISPILEKDNDFEYEVEFLKVNSIDHL